MKKIFNLRPILLCAISLIVGIVVVTNYVLSKTVFNLVLLILFVTALVVLLSVCIFINFKNKSAKHFVLCALILVFSVVGMIGGLVSINPTNNLTSADVEMCGVVDSVKNYDNRTVVNVKNLSFNGEKTSGNLELVLFNYDGSVNEKILSGCKISANINLVVVENNFDNINYLINNINFKSTANSNEVTVIETNLMFKDVVKKCIKNNLDKFLNRTNASVAYSVLFGEKENMSASTYDVFKFSGLAHILAVSGLHVGFLVAMLVAFFKLIKCNKNVSNIIIFLILLLYAYLCNFTPSVLRAMIMSMVLIISKSYGKQYDALNSLSLSAIIVLLINPLYIYSVGFQLSFVCVLSIITLSRPIKQMLKKIKCPNALSSSLAVSLSVNLGIMCVTAQSFNEINFISVFSNLIVLPLFSVCFNILFVVSFLGLILPFINYLLIVPNLLLHFVKLLANMFAEINFLNFKVFKFSYLLVALSLFLIYFIGYALANLKFKAIVSCVIILVIVSGAAIINIPTKTDESFYTTSYTSSGNYLVLGTEKLNTILVLNGVETQKNVVKELNNKKVGKIDYVVISNFSNKDYNLISELSKNYNIKKVFVNSIYESRMFSGFNKFAYVSFTDESFEIDDVKFKHYFNYNNDYALKIEHNNNLILMLSDDVSKNQVMSIAFEELQYDYIFTNKSFDFLNFGLISKYFVTNKNIRFQGEIIYLFNN